MKKTKTFGTLLILLAGCLWGLMSIFVRKMEKNGLVAMDIVTVRVWISAIILIPVMLIYNRKLLKIKPGDIWCFAGTGIISLTLFNFCYFSNISLTSPGVAAVLLYTSPVFVMIMSAIFFKEKLGPLKIIACFMTFAGCALVGGLMSENSIGFSGVVLGILSGIGYALYSIFGRVATDKGYSSLTVTVYTLIFACIGTSPFADFGKISNALFCNGPENLIFAVAGAVLITLIPYYVYTKGLMYIETGTAGVIATIEVVVAAVVGYFCFSETFGAEKILGIFLVITALAIMNMNFKKKN